jgi:hypothetical protein
MKKLNLFTLLFALISMIGCQKSTNESSSSADAAQSKLKSTAVTFTVLSYNVAGLPELLSSATNRQYCSGIIGTKISAYDIVNMQEDFNYHAYIYATDTHPYRTATSGGAGIGSGLNTVSNFPFSDDIDRVTWDDCSGTSSNPCLTPKGFTWQRVHFAEGVYVDVYNIHTNAGTATADETARAANLAQLVTYIEANSTGNAYLIFGDTNSRYTRSADNIRILGTSLGVTDAWVQLIKGGIAPALGSDALVCADTSVILTDFSCEVVDKIFYHSNNYITLTPLGYNAQDDVLRYGNGYMLSDHRAAYTKFQYTLSSTLSLSDQFGGPHGTSYNDVNSIPTSPSVTKIGIRAGSRVDQVNLTLSNGTTFTHGGTGGKAYSLTMGTGEYVKSVKLCSGTYNSKTRIFYIKFTTSSGNTLSGGTSTSSTITYTAPTGYKIVGFHGRSGDELDKMGVIYAPI